MANEVPAKVVEVVEIDLAVQAEALGESVTCMAIMLNDGRHKP